MREPFDPRESLPTENHLTSSVTLAETALTSWAL